jgi:hypothetical protein
VLEGAVYPRRVFLIGGHRVWGCCAFGVHVVDLIFDNRSRRGHYGFHVPVFFAMNIHVLHYLFCNHLCHWLSTFCIFPDARTRAECLALRTPPMLILGADKLSARLEIGPHCCRDMSVGLAPCLQLVFQAASDPSFRINGETLRSGSRP